MSSPKHILSFNLAMKFCGSNPTQLELPKILVRLRCTVQQFHQAPVEDTDDHRHGSLNVCRRWAKPTDTRGGAVFHIWLIALRRTFHLHHILDNKYVPASLLQDCWRPPAYIFFSRPTTWFFVATTLWQAGRRRERRHISRRKMDNGCWMDSCLLHR